MSLPPSTPCPNSRRRDPSHIPRPPNCFILFRSSRAREINEQQSRITGSNVRAVDLSRALAEEWKNLPQYERQFWREKAEIAKRLHAETHPEYKYRPVRRVHRPNRPRKEKINTTHVNITHISGTAMQSSPHIYSNPSHLSSASSPHIAHSYYNVWGLQCPTYLSSPANQSPLPFLNNHLEFRSPYETAGGTFGGHSS